MWVNSNRIRNGVRTVTTAVWDDAGRPFKERQTALLNALAAPLVAGEPKESLFRRIARHGRLSMSRAEKAWRGYAVLRSDEWVRIKEKVERSGSEEKFSDAVIVDRAYFHELQTSLADLHQKIDALAARERVAVSRSRAGVP